jgi:hypothetical protein
MEIGSTMKRSNAVRKSEEHDRANPFCAAHPDLSSHRPSTVKSDPDYADHGILRKTSVSGIRAHVRSDHVLARKKK